LSEEYTLYGSYASYYTAKARAYLRKKGIPFVERLPSDPLFRNKVRATSGSARIPQLLTPEGEVIQDSVEILDHLEALFPAVPAIPSTPRQRVFVHLMELLASEGLVSLAWQHRWMFEENLHFVKMDFGRSFKPQGSDEELMKYGNLIADRMMSYGLPESTQALRDELDARYLDLLRLFESHLIEHPYFLGGHPSAADYAIMGALHAHLGRDPAGLRMMQNHAPRTFRWVEHMLVPEIQSPEFFGRPVEYLAEDMVPETSLAVLEYIAGEYGEKFVLDVLAFNQAMDRRGPPSGHPLDPEHDQPTLAAEEIVRDGVAHTVKAGLHGVWLSQRARVYYHTLSAEDRHLVADMLGAGVASELLSIPVTPAIVRMDNRLLIA
jgi:glutathione S-transferase